MIKLKHLIEDIREENNIGEDNSHIGKISFSHIKSSGNRLGFYFTFDKNTKGIIRRSIFDNNYDMQIEDNELNKIIHFLFSIGIKTYHKKHKNIGEYEVFISNNPFSNLDKFQIKSLISMVNVPIKFSIAKEENFEQEPEIEQEPEENLEQEPEKNYEKQ